MEYLESYGMDTRGPRALARVLAGSIRSQRSSLVLWNFLWNLMDLRLKAAVGSLKWRFT